MSSVTVLSSSSVSSFDPSSWEKLSEPLNLGPLDSLVFPIIPVAVNLLYGSTISSKRLQRALERTLDYYPHLTGRLHLNEKDGTRSIRQLGSGAEFVVAECKDSLPDHLMSPSVDGRPQYALPRDGNDLLPPFMPEVASEFILSVQLTTFRYGAVALGVRILHTVSDAEGFFVFVRDLAEIYKKLEAGEEKPVLANPPTIESYLASAVGGKMDPEESRKALAYKPTFFHTETASPASAASEEPPQEEAELPAPQPTADTSVAPPPSPPPTTGRFMRFSAKELAALKSAGTSPAEEGGWVSTFDALAAHLWQRVFVARRTLRKQDPSIGELSHPDFLTPINVRSRLPALGSKYTGNALLTTYTEIDPDVLASGPLWKAAKIIHDLTRLPAVSSPTEIDATIRWMAAQPNMSLIRQGFRFGTGAFMVSAWNKMEMFESCSFKAREKPVAVLPPFTPISLVDGLVYLLPTERDNGDVDVNMSISEPLWAILDADREFRKYL